MTALILCILCSVFLVVLFKLFNRYQVDTFQAIVFNYLTAVITGVIANPFDPNIVLEEPGNWIFWALGLGVFFISLFVIIGKSVQEAGITLTTVANKMSLAIPVAAGVWLYNESLGWIKLVGILVAMLAVTLSSWTNESSGKEKNSGKSWLFPFIIFVGSGLLDTSMKFVEAKVLSPALTSVFLIILFLTAGSIGSGILTGGLILGKLKFHYRNLIGGIALGIPNYFSIYFLLEALKTSGLDSTVIFPIMNVGTVLLSAVAAILLFKEKLSKLNYLGLALSIAAIVLIALA